MAETPEYDTAVLDIDGTLVDTNYHQALAWYRAFRRYGSTLPVWRLHRAIEELRSAGARDVFDSVPELHQALDRVLGRST